MPACVPYPCLHIRAAWQNNGIPVRAITTIILTHIHADHDAGTFQQIVKEGHIHLMTTKTIHDSFIRKYGRRV